MSDRPLAPGEYPWPQQRPWPAGQGPYIRAATLCEALIEERSGAVSVVRLLNRMYIRGQPFGPTSFPVTLFLSMEKVPGDEPVVPIRIMVATPIGVTAVDEETTVEPKGKYREAQINFQMHFPIIMDGTHVIGIAYEDRLLTAVTVELVFTDDDPRSSRGTPVHSRWEIRRESSPPPGGEPSPSDPGPAGDEDTSD